MDRTLQSLFDNMLEGLASCRVLYENGRPYDFIYLSVNAAFERLTGLTDVVGKRVSEIIPGIHESNPELLEAYSRVALSGTSERFETYLAPLDQWFAVSVYSPEREHFVAAFDVITGRKRIEESLRESEERYRGLFENIPTGLYRTTPDGRILDVNPAMVEMLGYPDREFLLAVSAFDLYADPADRTRTLGMLAQGGALRQFEVRFRRRDGAVIWVRDSVRTIRDSEGRLLHFEGSMEDITERKQSQEALANERRLLRTLIDTLPDHIYVKDVEGRMVLINDAQTRAFGLNAPDEAIGKTDFELGPSDMASRYREIDRTVVESARPVTLEEPYVTSQGEMRWTWSTKAPLRDASGEVFGLVGMSRDITERKQADEALRESEQRYHELFDNAFDGIFLLDVTPDGRFKYAGFNTAEEKMTGFSNADKLGRYVEEGVPGPPGGRLIANYRRCIEAGAPISYEEEDDLPVGHACFQTLLIPVRDATGRIYRIVGMAHDVTARKKLEEQLRQSQKMEAMGTLAGGVAHDFNNLLTVITGNAVLALNGLDPAAPRYEELQSIRTAAERAASLTRQLLAFSRRHVLQPRVLNLNHVITDTTKMLRRMIGEDVLLSTVLAPDLGYVKVDPGYLEQVIMNLVINAREAMPQGGQLVIRTANAHLGEAYANTHADANPGEYVVLSVHDNGCGMDEETLTHIFEPFFTTKERGTGLGLATVYGIVKQSGGHLSVASQEGRGTTFDVCLPRAELTAGGASDKAAVPDLATGGETILLAEDEPAVRTFTSRCLRALGYTVLEADSGEQALHVAADHGGRIDLLVTDVVMPHMSGKELAGRMRESRPDFRVLFVSGYTAGFFGAADPPVGADRLLEKPFSLEALAGRVREALDDGASR